MIDLQIAVAKAMGWTDITASPCRDGLFGCALNEKHLGLRPIPPLTLDLMWEAEEMLPKDNSLSGWVAYSNTLMGICGSHSACVHATAEKRAKAWLKVRRVEL
jgi:hypothetical protein